tara:strand:+ start:201 stop:377 length:177 start_codon:yes stop_codon:yes gene_type:complete
MNYEKFWITTNFNRYGDDATRYSNVVAEFDNRAEADAYCDKKNNYYKYGPKSFRVEEK